MSLFHDDDDVLRSLQDGVVVVVEEIGLDEPAERHAPFDERAILLAIGRGLLSFFHDPEWSGGPAFAALSGKRNLSVGWINDQGCPEIARDLDRVQPDGEALDAVLFLLLGTRIRWVHLVDE